jgi:hypothetical protein
VKVAVLVLSAAIVRLQTVTANYVTNEGHWKLNMIKVNLTDEQLVALVVDHERARIFSDVLDHAIELAADLRVSAVNVSHLSSVHAMTLAIMRENAAALNEARKGN